MAEIIIMPKQGLQMTEGLITQWLKNEGDAIKEGEPLFEMETDKLTITIDSTASGTLLKILQQKGERVPIAQPIAVIGAQGEDISSLPAIKDAACAPAPATATTAAITVATTMATTVATTVAATTTVSTANQSAPPDMSGTKQYSTPRASMRAEELGVDIRLLRGTGPEGLIIERDVLQAGAQASVTASPLARKLAQTQEVSLYGVTGSGPRGKILAQDVRAMRGMGMASEKADIVLPISGMRRIIAQRMKESLQEMAQTTHTMQVDMTEAVRLRQQWQDADGTRISYNDIILRCVAQALCDCPYMNAVMTEDAIIQKQNVHIGMAVATDAGLLVPVIKNADLLSLKEIASTSADLAVRVKENRIQPAELQGGTFTVSNLGMYDVDHFTAIINAPEVGILAVGALKKQPVVMSDDTIGIRPMIQLTLTYDHRVVDGAPAAIFLKRIKTLLECPALML